MTAPSTFFTTRHAMKIEEIPVELHDLLPFCDRESTRYQLGAPCTIDDQVYATNARIAVRRPNTTGIQFVIDRFPPIKDVFQPFREENCTVPATVELPPCETCKGARFITSTECGECDGEGHYEHDCDCRFCKVEHEGTCSDCNGTGSVEAYEEDCFCMETVVKFKADKEVNMSMCVALGLSKLTNLRVSKYIPNAPTYFVADGGVQGVFMPRTDN